MFRFLYCAPSSSSPTARRGAEKCHLSHFFVVPLKCVKMWMSCYWCSPDPEVGLHVLPLLHITLTFTTVEDILNM